MDPHMDIDMDADNGDSSKPKHYQGPPGTAPSQQQQHRAMHHHSPPSHRLTSPQVHHLQGPPVHPIMPPQRQPYYAASSPDPSPAASSGASAGGSSAPHYRRPSSPGPYVNPPPGAYAPGAAVPSASSHPSHYRASQAFGRHPEYAKDDYRYSQQDRRREYETSEIGHDYAPIARDPYRGSSPTRLHHSSRDPAAAPSARRHPSAVTPAAYPTHPTSSTSAPGAIYQGSGPVHDAEILDRDRRSAHSYSRYPARSPSPGPGPGPVPGPGAGPYGSPPGIMSYRQYYDHPSQQHPRAYQQDYYASDGEGEQSSISQHHHYQQQQQQQQQQAHSSRAPSYRSWPAGSREAPSQDYPSASHQSSYYPSSRQPIQSDRYGVPGSVPVPHRAVSPYQPYPPRQQSGHPARAPAGAWAATRSPEMAARQPLAYRRRSTSVDEGVDRDKYYPHQYHGQSSMRPRSRSPPPRAVTPPTQRGHSPVRYQYESSPYSRGMQHTYEEPTYIPSRSPSPVRTTQHRNDRKAPAMSIAQLLSDNKTSQDPSLEYRDERPTEDRSRTVYRQYPQDSSPTKRYQEHSPRLESSSTQQRYNEPVRGPGQLADRARMLPNQGHVDLSPTSSSHDTVTRTGPPAVNEATSASDDYPPENAPLVPTRLRDDSKAEPPLHDDVQSNSTTSAKTEIWPDTEQSDNTRAAVQDASGKAPPQPVQVKRRPKAEQQEKRSIKAKTEDKETPVEEVKVKAKRGRKPKVKDNPLEGPAPPLAEAPNSNATAGTSTRVETASKVSNGGLKRQRAADVAMDDAEGASLAKSSGQEMVDEVENGAPLEGSDSDQEDYSQHKDLMTYMLEVHKRSQKVQKAYEKQSSRKRRKLHEKFLAKQGKRLEAKGYGEGSADLMEEEGFLGTRDPSVDSRATSQQPQPAPAKGRGRGRKKLQAVDATDNTVKRELDEESMPKETKAEKKRRERKEAAEAAAMAQVQAIKAKARAQENELAGQEDGDDEDQDAHVPRSNLYDDESDDQDFGHDRRINFGVSDDERETTEQAAETDEETLARRQEKEYEAKRRAIWDLIAQRQIREISKIVANTTSIKLQNCKKVAQLCQREARKAAARTVKPSKEIHQRARKANKEMLFFWKRNEREEREMRKRAEKEAIEKLRIEEEMREARRQARKLNFLITQTELYSHFIGKKIGTEAAEADDDAAPVRMQPTGEPGEDGIMQDPNHTPLEGEPDFEEASDEALAAQAKWGAQQALLAAQERTRTFDQEAKEYQEKTPKVALNESDLDEMNFQNPSSMPTVTEIEQPKMLMCQLKGYQIKGLNWLANLYEQGINGILADEMGLGKTVQSISLMAYLAETQNIWGPFLVIAPASTLHNWQQEFTKFTPDLKALPYWGNMNDRKTLRKFWQKKQVYNREAPFHVVITSYQLVVSDEKYFQRVKWQYMVLDEAQAIKSSSSARWKTLLGFNCRNRLLLTGTPIQNSMQELWALLHFIMPSLFDSHEEFSEWFSKDIESHAENKGTLNEHQLKRLHMILKPFMLRRIKKNVQNELGDKIELEVSCELTARQRALYRGLKEKISIAELLEKVSSLDDSDSVDSLMNLVMQFRKVCNHPELFERADVVSPLALCTFSQTPSIAREGNDLFVAYTTRSTISYSIPKRLYREGGILRIPSEQSNAGVDTKYLDVLMNIWTPENIQESMFEDQGAFSFLRFTDYSPAQVSQIARSHLLDRFARHLEMSEARSRRGYSIDWDVHEDSAEDAKHPGNTYAKFLICESTNPFSLDRQSLLTHTEQLGRVLETSELGEYLPMMESAYRPKAVAPPIEMICSDRSFLVDQQEELFNPKIRQMLLGVPEFMTEARHNKEVEPMMDLWQVNNGRGLLGEPSLSSVGYSTIEVPQMKQLVMDSGKLAVLDKLLVELKAGGHRVLVYFQMTKMIDLMEEYLTYRQYKYLRLDGSSKISDRRDMVTDWQTRPEIFIFLLSTRAGGLGINLTAADTVIFYDSDWNPTVDQQAMDRAHRLGQTRQVTVYRLITRGTIEERILQRAKQKDEIQKVVISGGEFKQNVEFKPREIVSLLLDDDELASKLQEQQMKRKVEEEAKSSRKGVGKGESGRASKKAKKDGKDTGGISTPSSSAAATPGKARTLEEMWADLDNQNAEPAADNIAEGSAAATKGKRTKVPKEKTPKEPKPKKEKEPKVKKPARLTKKAQAAAAAAAAAAAENGGSGLGLSADVDADGEVDIDMMDL
ncbi:putative DNA helicase ino80 [Dissophora globulifera]|uniref:Chromatin-remodeling ATPase INO80 n=1 Tax=Dissophora globulifera TaxID=979702 RepID=A0A9P6RCJ3_9FUNG|nr:putative DNA helicase ino80 [Dissophora globulifera]